MSLFGGGSSNPEYTPEELEMLKRRSSGSLLSGIDPNVMNKEGGPLFDVGASASEGAPVPEGATWLERLMGGNGETSPYAKPPPAPELSQSDSLGPLLALLNQRKGQAQPRAAYKPEFGGYLGSLLGG